VAQRNLLHETDEGEIHINMLEKPELKDEKILSCLQNDHGLTISQLTFLPLGADINTAVYRAVTKDGASYFVKLRKDNFDPTSVTLPKFLSESNIPNIIPPITTKKGQPWTTIESFKLILYPFIEGRDGFHIDLTGGHWFDFGNALGKIHHLEMPQSIKKEIHLEAFHPKWREAVRGHLKNIESATFPDSIAHELARFLKEKHAEILDLLHRTERLAHKLQTDPPPFVICHSDVHAGNILIDTHGHFYIVDWDNPILAPKERDLMFIGGAQGFRGHTLEEEERLFYKGYGPVDIDQVALAYYRYERIIDDIAAYCDELFSMIGSVQDRAQSLKYLKSNFLSGGTIEVAYAKDKSGLE
jgi:spectinomycin phosphotransferase